MPCGGQENSVAYVSWDLAGNSVATDTRSIVVVCPRPDELVRVSQIVPFCLCGHAPVATPVGGGSVVFGLQHSLTITREDSLIIPEGTGLTIFYLVLIDEPPIRLP